MHSFHHYLQKWMIAALYVVTFTAAQFQEFVTRPYDKTVNISILQNTSPASLAPGYFFLTPTINAGASFGPQIFDNNGTLIWNGQNITHAQPTNLNVCTYNSTPVLCYNEGTQVPQGGHSEGYNRFLSSSYTDLMPVGTFGAKGVLIGPDSHELNTPASVPSPLFLQTVFQPRQLDLTLYGGGPDDWVWDGCFQSVDLPTGILNFTWCALSNGISLDETATYMWGSDLGASHPIAGNGSEMDPWDWFHINSVDLLAETGEYLVSSRHTNTLFLVCGAEASRSLACTGKQLGEVGWRLGGKHSDFAVPWGLSGQHMARFLSPTQITLFDDGSDGVVSTLRFSAGVVIDISSPTATVVRNLTLPAPFELLSGSQGSMQVLSNDNAVVGWGDQPFYSEFSLDGELLYHAQLGTGAPGMSNYRAVKYPWVGHPMTRPDVVVYASSCTGAVWGYVSWNGATEVSRWQFRSTDAQGEHGRVVAYVAKRGFETSTWLSGNVAGGLMNVVVDALDASGRVIGVSAVVGVVVPNLAWGQAHGCEEMGCWAGTDFGAAVVGGGNVALRC